MCASTDCSPDASSRKTILDLTNHIHSLLRQHRDVKAGLVNEKSG